MRLPGSHISSEPWQYFCCSAPTFLGCLITASLTWCKSLTWIKQTTQRLCRRESRQFLRCSLLKMSCYHKIALHQKHLDGDMSVPLVCKNRKLTLLCLVILSPCTGRSEFPELSTLVVSPPPAPAPIWPSESSRCSRPSFFFTDIFGALGRWWICICLPEKLYDDGAWLLESRLTPPDL